MKAMVTTSPSIVAWAFTMHAFTMHTGCVQLHGQILEFKRMVGDLLLNPLLTRIDKTNAEVSGRSHHRWTGRRLAKGTLRISVMGGKALKERIVGNELVTPIRSAFGRSIAGGVRVLVFIFLESGNRGGGPCW